MTYIVTGVEVKPKSKVSKSTQTVNPVTFGEDPPFDIGSFFWGLVAGGIITIVVEGVVLYISWPVIAPALGGLFV